MYFGRNLFWARGMCRTHQKGPDELSRPSSRLILNRNVSFLSSGLYRRYRNLTDSAKWLADLQAGLITAGVDFHHALKQILRCSRFPGM